MKCSQSGLFWALLNSATAAAAPPKQDASSLGKSPPVVSTTSGRVHGKIDPALPNVRQYLGIPYAVPPVGERRWAVPELLDQPGSDVQATQLPPSCMQYLNNQTAALYVRDVLEFNLQGLNTTGAISEDCLTLSVWAPTHSNTTARASSQAPVPVLIFIYGGGFGTGGQDVPYQIPAQWVDRAPDHIVVTFNYRVDIFGFPNAAGLSDQNLGLLDQRAAVQWCHENIAAFGGDPSRMVLWGQSAGSMSVDYYTFAYPDDPIVTGLIMDSATAQTAFAIKDTSRSNFTAVADRVGCAGLAGDPALQLSCMRGVDAGVIQDYLARYSERGGSPPFSFVPIIEDVVVFSNYTQRAVDGLQADLPAIIGTNAQDGNAFPPYDPNGPDPTASLDADLAVFFCPATNTIRLRQQAGLVSFRYLYYGNWTNVSPAPWMGAYHSSELPMLMGTHPNFRGGSSSEEYATSHAFQDAYVAFANDPRGGLAGQNWKPYVTLGSGDVRGFGRDGVPAEDLSIASKEALCV